MPLFQKKQTLYAVCNGRAVDTADIPDEAFSGGMLGIGYGIEPADGSFLSPVDGRVESIAETRHAYTIHSNTGPDILLHIGVDTVTLGGEGFTPLVKEGERVSVGQPLVQADLALIKEKGLPTVTAVLVTDCERLDKLQYNLGEVTGGKDAVMTFRL